MTAQVHERLILDGKQASMAFCPPLPSGQARVVESRTDETHEPQSEDDRFATSSTACWRRYVGTWELKDGRFYLIDLVGRFTLLGNAPLWADWFTGVLRIPLGEQLKYVHMGFGSVYEGELHIRIERGQEIGRRQIDNRARHDDGSESDRRNFPGSENRFFGDDYWD